MGRLNLGSAYPQVDTVITVKHSESYNGITQDNIKTWGYRGISCRAHYQLQGIDGVLELVACLTLCGQDSGKEGGKFFIQVRGYRRLALF